MINHILLSLILLAVAGIGGMLRACFIRAHDGHVNTFAEIREDIAEDLEDEPA